LTVTQIALRIDVDTYRGTRDGVPRLLDILARHGVSATFYFSVGPDNMGRHLWRLLRPRFLLKMLRSNAASLYGWGILFAGTMWPGRVIGTHLGGVIRAADAAGHEIGLHAWDHQRWQRRAPDWSVGAIHDELSRGTDMLGQIIGRRPDTSAAAGWVCNERVLEAKEMLGFRYNSDCRGRSVFVPELDGHTCAAQVPTTMPTYDELIGSGDITDENYNQRILDYLRPDELNVLTIHAEVEGIVCSTMFDEFLKVCHARGIGLGRLGDLRQLEDVTGRDGIAQAPVQGRDGDVCWQASALRQG
jgi:undecaprenyl phosphate-alpha-L-ara4FN deformylase